MHRGGGRDLLGQSSVRLGAGLVDSAAMTAYAITNFKDIDGSSTPNPDREAKFARSHIGSEHLGVSYFKYGPNFHATGGHSHGEQEEVYVVVSGSGRVKLDDEIIELKQWDVVRVSPAVVRAFEGGPEGMELVIAATDRPEGGDGVRVDDFWPEDA
jgi:mannose-6-phosphate isomerase-like protein (cupin superfamily)